MLTAQVQEQVRFERELVELRALVMDLSTRPAALAAQVRTLESAIEVLHANLAAARQYLATLFPQEPTSVISRVPSVGRSRGAVVRPALPDGSVLMLHAYRLRYPQQSLYA